MQEIDEEEAGRAVVDAQQGPGYEAEGVPEVDGNDVNENDDDDDAPFNFVFDLDVFNADFDEDTEPIEEFQGDIERSDDKDEMN